MLTGNLFGNQNNQVTTQSQNQQQQGNLILNFFYINPLGITSQNQSNLFGQNSNQPQSNSGKPLFGTGNSTNNNLFGVGLTSDNTSQTNNNLFGFQNSINTTQFGVNSSLFGNKQTSENKNLQNTGGSIFTGTTGTGISTNQNQQNPISNNLIFGTGQPISAQQTTGQNFASTGGIFSSVPQQQKQSGFFNFNNKDNQGHNQYTSIQNQQHHQAQQTQDNPYISSKKESDKKEIIDVVQSYLNCHNKLSPHNSFKFTLYNKINENSKNLVDLLQQPKPYNYSDSGEPYLIDQELWHKALRENPDSSLFYPTQISCPKDLNHRVNILEILQFQKLEYFMNTKKRINELNERFENEIENLNFSIKSKSNSIRNKQLKVIYKLETLAIVTGKANKNFELEGKLNTKINDLKNALTTKDSYRNKLKNLAGLTNFITNDKTEDEEDPMKNLKIERFEKNINLLKNIKIALEMNVTKLKKTINDLNMIKGDIDNFKKYERINK
jgi:hypothetical protein